MDESKMTLLKDWAGQAIAGWLATEKLDGCRAYWDGQALWTRGGSIVNLPRIIKSLPLGISLDGEIWAGRGGFTTARLATQYGKDCGAVRFVAFDCPSHTGRWTERIAFAKSIYHSVVDFWKVSGANEARQSMEEIVACGGEGIVLRNDKYAGYETGRSYSSLRMKP